MSRTLHELNPAERSAYLVYQSKLADRTLPASEHDACRRGIDELLWKGPNAQVLSLKAKFAELQARIERLEFHAGLNDAALPPSFIADPSKSAAAIVVSASAANPRPPLTNTDPFVLHAPSQTLIGQDHATVDPFSDGMTPAGLHLPNPHPSDAEVPAPKKERRGRPKGSKNKEVAATQAPTASPPVVSGEGKEQPATTVQSGTVTATEPSFTDRMMDPLLGEEMPDSGSDDPFGGVLA